MMDAVLHGRELGQAVKDARPGLFTAPAVQTAPSTAAPVPPLMHDQPPTQVGVSASLPRPGQCICPWACGLGYFVQAGE